MYKTMAAGGVVIGPHDQILIVNQNGDSWSLPKGHIDPGETAEAAALREIHEESGITSAKIKLKLGEYERFKIKKGGSGEDTSELKHIIIFLCTTAEEVLQPQDKTNPSARWVQLEDVTEWLTHPKDKEFFTAVKPDVLNFLRTLA